MRAQEVCVHRTLNGIDADGLQLTVVVPGYAQYSSVSHHTPFRVNGLTERYRSYATNGFNTPTPQPSKSRTLRVTMVKA